MNLLFIRSAWEEYWNSVSFHFPMIMKGILILLFFIFTGLLLKWMISSILLKKVNDRLTVNFFSRLVLIIFIVIGIIIFLDQVGLDRAASGLLAGAGVSAIILGFAFKDIGENFLSGFFLAFGRSFEIGHVVKIEEITGTVRGMNLRNTHIRTYDGKDVYVPNSILFKSPLTNFTRDGLLRHDFVIGIDYGEDIGKAIITIIEAIKKIGEIESTEALRPFVTIDEFSPSTINLRVFFWSNTKDFLKSTTTYKTLVMKEVVSSLTEKGFNLPADIIELKIYQEGNPIPVKLKKDDG